jgi:hypothetical protein
MSYDSLAKTLSLGTDDPLNEFSRQDTHSKEAKTAAAF